jgi:hypothetical protein
MGHTVVIAGSGPSLDLLRIEFPSNKFFEIASYGISYSARVPLMIHLLSKIPAVLSVIRKEHEQVDAIIKSNDVDFIISDNRYGCYNENIPSAIITHQLSIQAPLNPIANHYNKKLIRRFNECWVPDTPDHALSGRLSVSNIPHKFIGPLSRFTRRTTTINSYQVLGLVSGPEPHRTSFEEILSKELKNYSYKLVRGLPSREKSSGPIFNHLPSQQLAEVIQAAEVVVCRSGYSSIMDLAALNKKAIFVPTPGQTEQLYLARELERKKVAPMVMQQRLSLRSVLPRLDAYSGFTANNISSNYLHQTLREFLD